jgi:hypothetical protein
MTLVKLLGAEKKAVFGMLHRVALVITEISEESSASFTRVTRIGEIGTTLGVTSNRRTLRRPNDFIPYQKQKKNSVAFSPQANYTD